MDQFSDVPPSLITHLPDMSSFPNRPQSWDSLHQPPPNSNVNRLSKPLAPLRSTSAHANSRHEPEFENTVEAVIQYNQKLARDALLAIQSKRQTEEAMRLQKLQANEHAKIKLKQQQMAEQNMQRSTVQPHIKLEPPQMTDHGLHHQIQKSIVQSKVRVENERMPEQVMRQEIQRSIAQPRMKVENHRDIDQRGTHHGKTQQVASIQQRGAVSNTPTAASKQQPTNPIVKKEPLAESSVPTGAKLPECMGLIDHMKTNVNPEMKQGENKRMAIQLRKYINTTIGQLNNTREKMNQVFMKIDKQLKEIQGQGPLYYAYALNLLAKKLCRQAEAELRPDPTKAYPYGQIAVLLMARHNGFKDYLLARMYKFCPYLIPQWPVPKTQEDLKRVLRHKPGEKNEQYIERMTTHVALYAAIVQTTPIVKGLNNPLDISISWTLVAQVLNHEPIPLMAYLLETFLVIAGNAFILKYPRQGQKILHLLVTGYIPKCGVEVNSVAVRLNNYNKGNRFEIPLSDQRNPKFK